MLLYERIPIVSSNKRKSTVSKTIIRSVSGASFPLAGSVVVIYTLSGHTRTVAIIATTIAMVGHVVHALTEENSGDRADEITSDSSYVTYTDL